MLVALLGFCSPAAAQTTPDRRDAVRQPTAEDTREDLRAILETYPHSVGEILRRDPSLMARADYMAAYPDLVKFLDAAPRDPPQRRVLFRRFRGVAEPAPARPELRGARRAARRHGRLFSGSSSSASSPGWSAPSSNIAAGSVQSQVQADVHTKLMERMTSNEELLAYVQSPAGRRFLEAAPLRPETESTALSAPVGSIIWSMMAGVVLSVLGVGFRYAGNFVKDEAHEAFVVVGVIILALGFGFIIASLMALRRVVAARPVPARPSLPRAPTMREITLTDMERLGAFDEAERTFQMTEEAFRDVLRADGAAGPGLSGAHDRRRSAGG